MKSWYKQKTTWSAITTVIGAIGGVVTGTLPAVEAVQLVAPAVMAIFLRQGIESGK